MSTQVISAIRSSTLIMALLVGAGAIPAGGFANGCPHPCAGHGDPVAGFNHDASHGFQHDVSGGFLNQGAGRPNTINYNPGIYFGYGVGGGFAFSPSLTVIGPGGLPPFMGPFDANGFGTPAMGMGMNFVGGRGPNLPAPPRGLVDAAPARARRVTNPARAKEIVEVGDRSFRAHNIKRAEEKYLLAVKADPASPMPHVHLAQVSMARGQYQAAADHIRDAVTVAGDGAWLANVADIQAIFAEPADFARQLARLETHLQANPNDRDAWFVLGAETYLSGRTRQAFDVFQRLTDRRSDEALTAFLDASTPRTAVPAAN